MFDDFEDSPEEVKKEHTSTFNKNFFNKAKKQIRQEPYIPIAIYIDNSFTKEVKDELVSVAKRLLSLNYSIRINGDDKEIVNELTNLSKNVEVYIPWKNFNEIESKHYFNLPENKHLAQVNFSAWEKVPDSVKAFLARNIRMLFGDKNDSTVLTLITWSEDGATYPNEVSKTTGKASFIIKAALKYKLPVFNLGSDKSRGNLEKSLLRTFTG